MKKWKDGGLSRYVDKPHTSTRIWCAVLMWAAFMCTTHLVQRLTTLISTLGVIRADVHVSEA